MSLIDLARQVTGKLGYRRGGTGNKRGWSTGVVEPYTSWDTSAGLALGTLVRLVNNAQVEATTTAAELTVLGVVVGYFTGPYGDVLVEADCPTNGVAAVMTKGHCLVLIAANVDQEDYAFASATDGMAESDPTLAAGAFGVFTGNGITSVQDTAWVYLFGAVVMGAGGGGGSPLTTKGDLFGYDTADARVPVGTDGQVLTADSSDAQGVTWAAIPDPIPLTTKGDLFGFSTLDVRVAVGTNGQLLSARSGATPGIAWEALKAELEVTFTSPSAGQESTPFRVPYACTITAWYVTGNASGSIVVDVWRDTYANYPPTVADTIVGGGGNKPTLSAARTATAAPASWTSVALVEGDWVTMKVDSASGLTTARVTLTVERA